MESQRVLPSLTPTGDPRVDAAIGGLDALADTDLAGRPAILQEVHDRLREILGELGDPGSAGTAAPARPGQHGEQGGRGEHGEQGGQSEHGELGGAGQPGGPQPRQEPPRPGLPGSWPRRPGG